MMGEKEDRKSGTPIYETTGSRSSSSIRDWLQHSLGITKGKDKSHHGNPPNFLSHQKTPSYSLASHLDSDFRAELADTLASSMSPKQSKEKRDDSDQDYSRGSNERTRTDYVDRSGLSKRSEIPSSNPSHLSGYYAADSRKHSPRGLDSKSSSSSSQSKASSRDSTPPVGCQGRTGPNHANCLQVTRARVGPDETPLCRSCGDYRKQRLR